MNKLKALETSNNQLLSCLDYTKAYQAIDFEGMASATKSEDKEMPVWGKPAMSVEGDVATIKVRGLLVPDMGFDATSWGVTGYDVIEYYLDKANNDSNVESIVLDIDSFGGYVKGCNEAGEAIANSTKPVNTFVSGNMYSAAYWLGVSAKSITAKSSSGIGSIGVFVEHYDRSKMIEERGIKARIFKSGFWKGAFGSDRPLSEREQDRIQQDIEESAQVFFEHVASNRHMTAEAIKKLDGDTFSADTSLEIGLIDAVHTNNATKVATGTIALNTQSQTTENQTPTKISQEDDMAATQAELAAARAEARTEALAEVEGLANAKAERLKQIYALEVDDKVKEALTAEAFAGVELTAITALVEAMPKGFTAIMDDEKGAGVEMNPTEFADKPDAVVEAEAQQTAAAQMKETNLKGVL